MNTSTPFFNRLYIRIWLAVVVAVAVLTFLVGWAWRMSAERQLAETSVLPIVREVTIKNSAGETIGKAVAEPRVPGMGTEFAVILTQPMAAGDTMSLQMPRARRLNPQTGELEAISPQEMRQRLGRVNRLNHIDRDDRHFGAGGMGGLGGPPGRPVEDSWFKPPFGFVWMLGLVGLAVALGTYPLIRRLTKRLNTLQTGVDQWGRGDLSTRVKVSGNDEVAFLAERFNTAASRIEALVGSHKSLLANASHELRSPLARIKMGLELMTPTVGTDVSALPPEGANFPRGGSSGNSASPLIFNKHKDEISRNINELDQLIDEILLASRLDSAQADLGSVETVDLTGLAAEECAKSGAELELLGISDIQVQGIPKLLRRLMRNLLENANRYAKADTSKPVVLSLDIETVSGQKMAVIRVTDHGRGVPEALRERIFEPFYRAPGASEREGGVGLGLSLVKSIAQSHGGSVRCEAAASGLGACFVVTLPL